MNLGIRTSSLSKFLHFQHIEPVQYHHGFDQVSSEIDVSIMVQNATVSIIMIIDNDKPVSIVRGGAA